MSTPLASASPRRHARWIHLGIGVAIVLSGLVLPPPDGLSVEGLRALLLFAGAIYLWVTQPLELAATAVIGLACLPVLHIMGKDEAFSLFGNQAVFFVMAVFIMGAVLMQSGLATRAALRLLSRFDRSPGQLSTAVLVISTLGCAFLISHAVAAILFPILLEICRALDLPHGRSRFARRLLLSMSWGTIAGSNFTFMSSARVGLALGMLSKFEGQRGGGEGISFLFWVVAALPAVVLTAVMVALILALYHRSEKLDMAPAIELLRRKVVEMGPMTRNEKIAVLSLVAMLVGMVSIGRTVGFGTVALLATAINFVFGSLTFEVIQKYVSWSIVLLFGGAVAMASAVEHTQAVPWLVDYVLPQGALHPMVFMAIVGAACMFMTEFASNSAVIAAFLPVCMVLAERMGMAPRSMVFVTVIASGMAFMLPVSTPAMAMVFSSGHLRTRDSLIPGLILNVLSLLIILLVAWLWWPIIGLL